MGNFMQNILKKKFFRKIPFRQQFHQEGMSDPYVNMLNIKIECLTKSVYKGSVWDIFLEPLGQTLLTIKVLSRSEL